MCSTDRSEWSFSWREAGAAKGKAEAEAEAWVEGGEEKKEGVSCVLARAA